MKKRLIAMLLVFAMVLAMAPAAFANGTDEPETIKYVSIGDSMTNGYGFNGYNQDLHLGTRTGDHMPEEYYNYFKGTGVYGQGSYALQFEKYLAGKLGNEVDYKGHQTLGDATSYDDGLDDGVDHIQLATSAFRIEELATYLGLVNQYDYRVLPLRDGYLDNSWAYIFTNCDDHRWATDSADGKVPLENGPIDIGGHTSCGDRTYLGVFLYNTDTTRQLWGEDELGPVVIGPNPNHSSKSPVGYATMFQYLSKYYQENVADADIISLHMGNAGFDAYFMDRLFKIWGALGEELDEPVENLITLDEVKAQLCKTPAERDFVQKVYDTMCSIMADQLGDNYDGMKMGGEGGVCELLTYITFSYMYNYKRVIERIGQLNSDAKIMIVGMLNSYSGLYLDGVGGERLDLGELMGTMYEFMNSYVAGICAAYMENNPAFTGKILYVEQPENPEMIASKIGELAATGWGTLDNGRLDGTIVRYKTITAYNNTLYEAFELAGIAGTDNTNHAIGDCDANITATVEQALAQNPDMTIAKMLDILKQQAPSTDWQRRWICGSLAYLGCEAAMVKSLETPVIDMESLVTFADTVSMVDILKDAPKPFDPNAKMADVIANYQTFFETNMMGVIRFFAFNKMGNGIAAHPTPSNHDRLAANMIAAYEYNNGEGYTVQDKCKDDPDAIVVNKIYTELTEKGLLTTAQIEEIRCYAVNAVLDGTLELNDAVDFIYNLLFKIGDTTMTDEQRIEIITTIYPIVKEAGYLGDYADEIALVEGICGIEELQKVSAETTFDIVEAIYAAIADGNIKYEEIIYLAKFIYNEVFATTKIELMANDGTSALNTKEKLAVLGDVYVLLRDETSYLDAYEAELETLETLYEDLAGGADPLLGDEQVFGIFVTVFTTLVEEEEIDDAAIANVAVKVGEQLMNDDTLTPAEKLMIVDKIANALGNYEGGVIEIPTLSEMAQYILENYEEIYELAYSIADENGYIGVADQYLTEIENIIASLDFDGIGLSAELVAELDALKAEVAEDIAALNAIVASPKHNEAADKFWALMDELREDLSALETTAKQAGSDAYDQFSIVYAQAKKQLDTIFKQAIAALKEEIKNAIGSVAVDIDLSEIKGVIAELETAIADIKAQIAEIKKYTAAGLDGVADKLTAELAEAEAYLAKLNKLVADIEDLVNEIENEPELTLDKVTAIVALAEDILGDTMILVNEIETALTTLAQVYSDVVPQLLAAVEGPAKDALNATDAEVKAVTAAIEAAYAETLAAITTAAANIETIVCATAQSVYATAATAVDAIVEATEIAAQEINAAVVPALDTIKDEATKLAASTDAEIRKAGEDLLGLAAEIEQTLPVDEIEAELRNIDTIVIDIAGILENVEDIATAEVALGQTVTALEALGDVATKIYDIAGDDVIALIGKAADYADAVKTIAHGAIDTIGQNAAEAYSVSAAAVGTAADLTIKAVGTAIDAYEQAIIPAASEILTAVSEAASAVAGEVNIAVTDTTAAVNVALAQIDDSYTTVISAWQYAIYDATHGEYVIDCGSYYVSLGDSTVTGMNTGDPAYGNYGYQTVVPTSFAYKLAEKLGLDVETQFKQLALAGLRTSDLRYILDETFTPDEYALTRNKNRVDEYAGGYEAMRETYKAELAKADLITLSLGNCNFTDYISTQVYGAVAELIKSNDELMTILNSNFGKENVLPIVQQYVNLDSHTYALDWDTYLTTPKAKAELAAGLAEVRATLIENGIPETITFDLGAEIEKIAKEELGIDMNVELDMVIPIADLATQVIEWYAYAYVTHTLNYAEVVKLIHEYSDAHLVVLGLANPIEELVLNIGGVELALGDYLGTVFEIVNLTNLTAALTTDNTTYVAVDETESNTEVIINSGAEIDVLSFLLGIFDGTFDFHATAEGHTYMAETVYDALTIIPGEHEFVVIDQKPATCTVDGYVTYKCSVCGYEYTEVITATGHVYGDDDICDVCGHDKTPSGGGTGGFVGGGGYSWHCNGGKNCPSRQFEDLAAALDANPNIWWHEYTDYVISNKLMNGVSDTKFDPNGTTTRAMLVTVLWREAGSPVVDAEMPFEDVAADTWYTEAIRWAASKGIVNGMTDTEFAPDAKITREQMVTIFYRYALSQKPNLYKGNTNNITKFSDAEKVSDWAYDAMKWACGIKFVEGKENNNIAPAANATRAEMATFITRFIEKVL